jgi:hypothetical protein
MRACQPVRDGYAERGGVKLYYEVYGSGEPTVFLLPTWSIIHSRHWKMQILCRSKYDLAGDLRVLGDQAAWVYWLIRPPRTGRRWIRAVSRLVTAARGRVTFLIGTRWVMSWRCCSASDIP